MIATCTKCKHTEEIGKVSFSSENDECSRCGHKILSISTTLKWKDLSEEDLKQIAKDIHMGLIFTDRHISDTNEYTIKCIFMGISLATMRYSITNADEIGMIYEYMSKAGPSGVHGYPFFFSQKIINKEQSKKVWDYYEKYKNAMDSI